jgi:hypothetical protein
MRIQDLSWLRFAAWRRVRAATLGENGAAMVEFAFVAPLFIGLLCAIMELSGIMFVQAILEGSAREASRYGLTGFTSDGVSREDQILSIVEDNTYGIIDMDELHIDTLVYENFGDIGQPGAVHGRERQYRLGQRRAVHRHQRQRHLGPRNGRRLPGRPGRTGLSQRSSSIPGEPIAAARFSRPSANRRMNTHTVCQPLAISPP